MERGREQGEREDEDGEEDRETEMLGEDRQTGQLQEFPSMPDSIPRRDTEGIIQKQ